MMLLTLYLISIGVVFLGIMFEAIEVRGVPAFIVPYTIVAFIPAINTVFGLILLIAIACELIDHWFGTVNR